MPREEGRVISVLSDYTNIAVYRKNRCEGCESCEPAQNGKYMIAAAVNEIGAELGDMVVIESNVPETAVEDGSSPSQIKMRIVEITSKAGLKE